MKERPILFSGGMVRALLAGTKTQTRRVVKPQPPADKQRSAWYEPGIMGWAPPEIPSQHWHRVRCPYGQPGDRLWVREAWRESGEGSAWHYAADGTILPKQRDKDLQAFLARRAPFTWESYKWRPSIHMPRAASRITLEVTGVRVERLQDISEKDAWAEGCEGYDDDVTGGKSGYSEFHDLWKSINGSGSWDANPWVWVVEFKRLEAAA